MSAEKIASINQGATRFSNQRRSYALAVGALLICFSVPLYHMLRFAVGNELYSYIPLMPFVSWYLLRQRQKSLPANPKSMWGLGVVFLLAGAGTLAWYVAGVKSGGGFEVEDASCLSALSFFLCFVGISFIFLGDLVLKAFAYPIGMLIFMVPMPVFLREGVETFLQYGSAYTADGFFRLSGMAFVREDLIFRLPGTSLQVAPECSGIHSTWILFITSLLAGYLFLRSPWRRLWLTLFVIPLALLRNGFRVFVIGELCVHIGPHMIDSWIHRHGGPVFFVLSLIPFFMVLSYLVKSERAKSGASVKN